jgi:hypothetical protein
MADNSLVVRQHYVPRTYLKHFAVERNNEFFIKALPRDESKTVMIFESNITNVCMLKDLYTLPGNTAEEKMLLEKFYSDNFESEYNSVYNILVDNSKTTINDVERNLIISSVITMFYRNTKWISLHNGLIKRVIQEMFLLCEQTGKDYFIFENDTVSIKNKTVDDLYNQFAIEQRPVQVLTQLQVAMKLILLRNQYDGIFISRLIDSDTEYITSDNPVIAFNPTNNRIRPFDYTNFLKLPLNNKFLLTLIPNSDKSLRNTINRKDFSGSIGTIERLTSNYEQMSSSERFILGSEKALKQYITTKDISEKSRPNMENV